MRERYVPLVDRVADRENSTTSSRKWSPSSPPCKPLCAAVTSASPPTISHLATRGAEFARDPSAGGFRVVHIYRHDPDLPSQAPPLGTPPNPSSRKAK